MTGQAGLLREVGLIRPIVGSLGVVYILVLLGGCIVAVVIGDLFQARSAFGLSIFFSLVVWQPLVEEMLFRGVIQGYLSASFLARFRWGPLSAPNVIASLAFTAIHFVAHPPVWALLTFLPSLAFGVFRERSGSIWPGFILHGCYNGAFFLPTALGLAV